MLAEHDYRVLRPGVGRAGNVLLRAPKGTVLYFGLDALPPLDTVYERNGGLQLFKYRTSPRKVNWQGFRIEIPELYPSGKRFKGWSFSLSANHRQFDFAAIAAVIEDHGVAWTGFQRSTGAKYMVKECLLAGRPHVKG